MWTRTWWVRPVSSRHSTSAASLSAFEPLPVGHRALAATAFDDRDLLAVGRRAGERRVDRAFGRLGHARRRSRDSAGRSNAPRTAWPALRGRRRSWRRPAAPTCPCRCGGRCPGRATPPMPDRLAAAMVEQRVDQRPVEIAGGRMDDQAGGLVDDQQMLVLEHDRQRDVLRLVVRRLRLGNGDAKALRRRGPWSPGRGPRLPLGLDRAAADQRLQPFARQGRDGVGERAVEPPARVGRLQAHVDRLMAPHPRSKYGLRRAPLQWRGNLAPG